MSFDLESTAPYFKGKVRQVPFSTIFFVPLLNACSEHHVVVLSKDHDGYVMGEILRFSSLLLTSRYHAQVLATGTSVPAVAVSMDERLDNLAAELDVPRELLLHVDQKDLAERILMALDYAQDNRDAIEQRLDGAHARLEGVLDDMAGEFALYTSARSGRQRDYSGMAK